MLLQRRDWLTRRIERLEREFSARVGLLWQTDSRARSSGTGPTDLNRGIRIDPAGVVVNSPECADFAGSTLPLKWFCKVAVTSGTRIRAGLPGGWISAGKTGAGLFGT